MTVGTLRQGHLKSVTTLGVRPKNSEVSRLPVRVERGFDIVEKN